MIKKISLTLILICIIVSCGKKGDPEFEEPKKKTEIQSSLISKA